MLPEAARNSNTLGYDAVQILMIAAGIVLVVAVALIF